MADVNPGEDAVIARLDELQRESEQRTAELREIAAQLPAVVGRRAMIRTLVGDAALNPNKREIVRRAFGRLARMPRAVLRRLRSRLRRPG